MRQQEVVRAVEQKLTDAFKDKVSGEAGQKGEGRILDLWIDMPATNPALQGGYLQQNFVKLDKDFQAMYKATRAQEFLKQSMTRMD